MAWMDVGLMSETQNVSDRIIMQMLNKFVYGCISNYYYTNERYAIFHLPEMKVSRKRR